MAGPEYSLEEVHILFDALFFQSENLISNSNHHGQSSSILKPSVSNTIVSEHALITTPPTQLELRQNNPQDCQNLIIASVDRATVEISRTIIALNATFSQQLQQASISASNGIKAAQDSASSSIGVVVQSADIATSSASFMVTVANRAVVSATSALADASLSSSSDVASLSSSLGLLQASLISLEASGSAAVSEAQASVLSLQASASAAIAAAQAAIASATGSAAAQASSLLASANANLPPTATQTVVGAGQTNPSQPLFQVPSNVSLTPAQIAGIIVGAVAASVLMSLAVYFAIVRLRKRRYGSYIDEKYNPRSPKEVYSRSSSRPRTANTMSLKFNPPNSSNVPLPTRSALRNNIRSSTERPIVPQISPLKFQDATSRYSAASDRLSNSEVWPLGSPVVDKQLQQPPSVAMEWPLPSTSMSQTVPFSFELPALEAVGALSEPSRMPETVDRFGNSAAGQEQNSDDPFIDPLVDRREDLVDPFEDTPSIYSVSDVQAFDCGIIANSTSEPLGEIADPFNDPKVTSIKKGWDDYDYSIIPKLSYVETSLPSSTESAQPQQTEELIKPTISDAAAPDTPSLLQLQTTFMKKPPAREVEPQMQALESKLAKVASETSKDLVNDPPSFLLNYNPPVPEVEKVISPPPRRRPSLGSVRPLRKMLPPRQKTVSPPRRLRSSESENNFPLQISSPAVLVREVLSITTTPVATETTKSDIPRPSSQELRERTVSPLRRNPVTIHTPAEVKVVPVDFDTNMDDPVLDEVGDIRVASPQQKLHPVFLPMEEDALPMNGDDVDDREHRGRSMVRNSDIIEAGLSFGSQIQEDCKSLQAVEPRLSLVVQKSQPIISSSAPQEEVRKMELDLGRSPLRRNPVDISSIPRITMHRRTKTLPPPRQHIHRERASKRRSRSLSPTRLANKFLQLDRSPIPPPESVLRLISLNTTTTKRRSRSLSPPRLPTAASLQLVPLSRSMSRNDSPLRRNPTRTHVPIISFAPDSKPPTSSARVLKVASNGLFAQSLSKFQNLASQNPQDTMMASTEVTQRAIAGIYIPGSLREQAVRTVSKSRERRED